MESIEKNLLSTTKSKANLMSQKNLLDNPPMKQPAKVEGKLKKQLSSAVVRFLRRLR